MKSRTKSAAPSEIPPGGGGSFALWSGSIPTSDTTCHTRSSPPRKSARRALSHRCPFLARNAVDALWLMATTRKGHAPSLHAKGSAASAGSLTALANQLPPPSGQAPRAANAAEPVDEIGRAHV